MYDTDLVHAGGIEPHDGSVSQSVEHRPHGLLGVQRLCLEQLLHEALVEHRLYDVVQH